MLNVLVLPRYGRLGASSRLRMMQYVPYLQTAGFSLTVSPMLNDNYVQGLYRNKVSVAGVAISYARRLLSVLIAGKYDAVWLEKEMFPWFPAWLEPALLSSRIRLIVDYDDAVFHRYDSHRSPLVRTILGGKIDAVMRRADLVLAGNDYLAARARTAGCKHVEIMPTVIDLDRYPKPLARKVHRIPTVGWMGSPSTAPYLKSIIPIATALVREQSLRFVAIGAKSDQLATSAFEVEAWTEDTEVAALQAFDVGIMPLPNEPFEQGKCGYKLIQYMACGLPVVASPVGVNCQIVEHGVNGFLAETPEQWGNALQRLMADSSLRQRMGLAGRQKVESQYCLQVTGPQLAAHMREVVSHPRAPSHLKL